MEKPVVINICGNYVLSINGQEFVRAPNKSTATRYPRKLAKELSKPWKENVKLETISD